MPGLIAGESTWGAFIVRARSSSHASSPARGNVGPGRCIFEPPPDGYVDGYRGIRNVRWRMNPWPGVGGSSEVTAGCVSGSCIRVSGMARWSGFAIYHVQAFAPSTFASLSLKVKSETGAGTIDVWVQQQPEPQANAPRWRIRHGIGGPGTQPAAPDPDGSAPRSVDRVRRAFPLSSTRVIAVVCGTLFALALGCGAVLEPGAGHGNRGGDGGSSGGSTSSSGSSGGAAGSSSGGSGSGGRSSSGASSSGPSSSSSGGSSSGSSSGGASSSGGSNGSSSSSGAGSPGAVRSAGCGKTPAMTFKPVPNQNPNASPGSGNTVGHGLGGYVTIQSGGGSRDFAMRLPDGYDNNHPYWLSFTFHPNGGNAYGIDNGGSNGYEMAYYGLQKQSNNGAIFVAPQGLGGGWANSGGQDLKLVDDIIKLIEDNYCVDTTHIFAQGFSYGGGMSYAIACSRAKVFRGVAIFEGAQLSGCDGGGDPIALWQMVGLEDNVCSMGLATPIRDRFVRINGCTAQNPPQPPKGPPYLNPGGHVCTDYAGCSAGHPVRWCVHQSGHGNAIVDGTPDLYNSCATAPKSCSATCPCSWVPQDVWSWMSSL